MWIANVVCLVLCSGQGIGTSLMRGMAKVQYEDLLKHIVNWPRWPDYQEPCLFLHITPLFYCVCCLFFCFVFCLVCLLVCLFLVSRLQTRTLYAVLFQCFITYMIVWGFFFRLFFYLFGSSN